MGEAVQKGGFGTSVTPVSQFYFQQAFNNVMFGKWKKIADGYGKMVLGYFGKTPVEPDPEGVRITQEQLKLEPTKELPIDINDRNPKKGAKAAKEMLEKAGLPVTDENIFIAATCQDKGIQFLQGKATIGVRKEARKKEGGGEAASKASSGVYTVTLNSTPYTVSLQGNTAVVNGVSYSGDVKDGSAAPVQAAPSAAPVAAAAPVNVEAPLPGLVLRLTSKVGDVIKEGDTIMVLESMKMEAPLKSPVAGTITAINVAQGAQVKTGQALAVVSPAGGAAPAAAPQPAAGQAVPSPQAAGQAGQAPAPAPGTPVNVEAPLPGIILRLTSKPGDVLKAGDTLLVLESMKMETPIKAPQAGTVVEIKVTQGAQVKTGQILAVMA
jgi:pyruvate carboxylase subunit B